MGQKASKQKLGEFHHSVRNGNIEHVKTLLVEGIGLEDQDDVFGTPLHEAVCFDRLDIVELLLQHKAGVNTPQKQVGDTPLCIACRKGLVSHAEVLVRNGARINQTATNGYTPLHYALENKHEAVAQYLIGASASVNILDKNGLSCLHVACKHLCKQSVELILSSNTSTTSTTTAIADHVPIATTVTSTTLNLHDLHNMTPLLYACQEGDIQMVEILLKAGAKTRYDIGRSAPLHVVTNLEVAKLLLSNGADVNARDENYATPLHHACVKINGGDLVKLFLEHRSDLSPHDNPTRSTPLHCACTQGAFGNAQLLLMGGADPNAVDVQRNTPLHVASKLGYTGIVKLLTEHNADPKLQNTDGQTPAELALSLDD